MSDLSTKEELRTPIPQSDDDGGVLAQGGAVLASQTKIANLIPEMHKAIMSMIASHSDSCGAIEIKVTGICQSKAILSLCDNPTIPVSLYVVYVI